MDTPDSERNLDWGAALADTLASFPAVAHELRTRGIDADPTELSAALQFTGANENAGRLHSALVAMFTTLNRAAVELFSDAQTAQSQFNHLQSQLDEVRDLNTRLLSALAQKPKETARRLSHDPEKFDGSQKNIAERQETYISWKTQILLNFTQDKGVFDSEDKKVLHICGLLSGEANTNNSDMLESITKNPNNPSSWQYQTSTDFLAALDKQYATLDLAHAAGISFDKLHQANRPFQNFLAEFSTLAKKCRKTDEQKVENLKKKVSEEIATKIANDPNPPARDDFTAWATKCQTWYNNQVEYEHNQKLRTKARPQDGNQQPPSHQPPSHQPQKPQDLGDPMQLDVARFRPQIDRNTCMAQGLCFYCKEPGHSRDACGKKKAVDARRAAYGITPAATPQDNQPRIPGPPQNYYRGNGYRGRGRGGVGNFGHAPYPGPYNQAPYPGPYNRLQMIHHGFVEEEVDSPAPSDSVSQVFPEDQGKA